ncbi:MAG: four helix bundle protein [Alphaproteobacteria bacterium]|nr:four helix bundle protein [Alphaproteobacteria bacterium]
MQANRHQEAVETTQQLVESIAQLTRFLPSHEEMVMVPMMREAVMTIQKSVMMLAIAQLNAGDSDYHCAEALGKIEVLRTYLQISFDLEYIGSDDFNRLTGLLEIVLQKLSLPTKPKLQIVK